MSSDIYAALLSGQFTQPDAIINRGIGPLPSIPSWAPPSFKSADGQYNQQSSLLGNVVPYAYGANPSRITTQTQMNIPNKVQLVIPRLFIPAATASGGMVHDPILEHATTDGDLVFSLRMNYDMERMGSKYCIMPYTNAYKSLKLVNLATANYLLWGLQVGAFLPDNKGDRWVEYWGHFCKNAEEPFAGGVGYSMENVWNFLQTYMAPYGVQHGSDMQGGQHEGSSSRVVTHSNDYVSAFAIEGKLLRVSNLWRASEINENDDLVLQMAYMPPQMAPLQFNLCSSSRANRSETAPCPRGWWYLKPVVLPYKTVVDVPHIHIGRSQKAVSAYTQSRWGLGMPPWNARGTAQGTPLQMTFEPDFVMSDFMTLRMLTQWILPGGTPDDELPQHIRRMRNFGRMGYNVPDDSEDQNLEEIHVKRGRHEPGAIVGGDAAGVEDAAASQMPRPIVLSRGVEAPQAATTIDDEGSSAAAATFTSLILTGERPATKKSKKVRVEAE